MSTPSERKISIDLTCPTCGQEMNFGLVTEMHWAYEEPRLPTVTLKLIMSPMPREDGMGHELHNRECGASWALNPSVSEQVYQLEKRVSFLEQS